MTRALNSASLTAQNLARLGRPQNVLYSGLLCIETAAITNRIVQGLICYILLFCLYAVAASYNNFHDVRIDKLNKRQDNPLASGKLPQGIVGLWMVLNCVFVIVLQLFLQQPISFVATIVYLLLVFIYSWPRTNLQAKGFAAPLLLSICYGTIPVILAGAPQHSAIALLAGTQILLLVPLLLAKDYKDEQGDRLGNKRTPLVRYGKSIVRNAAMSIALCAVVACEAIVLHSTVRIYMGSVIVLSIYLFCIVYIHYKEGKLGSYFLRLPQICLLAMNFLLAVSLNL